MVELEINWHETKRNLAKTYSKVNEKKLNQAVYRALNHTIKRAKTRASTYVRSKLNASKKSVDARMRIVSAGPKRLETKIISSSRPLRAASFPFSARKGRKGGDFGSRPGAGLSVKIHKGRRKLIARAFVRKITRKRRDGQTSTHVGIFARGRYGANGFNFIHGPSTGKGKMTQIVTTSIPQKLDDDENMDILHREMGHHFPVRLEHLLKRASGMTP